MPKTTFSSLSLSDEEFVKQANAYREPSPFYLEAQRILQETEKLLGIEQVSSDDCEKQSKALRQAGQLPWAEAIEYTVTLRSVLNQSKLSIEAWGNLPVVNSKLTHNNIKNDITIIYEDSPLYVFCATLGAQLAGVTGSFKRFMRWVFLEEKYNYLFAEFKVLNDLANEVMRNNNSVEKGGKQWMHFNASFREAALQRAGQPLPEFVTIALQDLQKNSQLLVQKNEQLQVETNTLQTQLTLAEERERGLQAELTREKEKNVKLERLHKSDVTHGELEKQNKQLVKQLQTNEESYEWQKKEQEKQHETEMSGLRATKQVLEGENQQLKERLTCLEASMRELRDLLKVQTPPLQRTLVKSASTSGSDQQNASGRLLTRSTSWGKEGKAILTRFSLGSSKVNSNNSHASQTNHPSSTKQPLLAMSFRNTQQNHGQQENTATNEDQNTSASDVVTAVQHLCKQYEILSKENIDLKTSVAELQKNVTKLLALAKERSENPFEENRTETVSYHI